jgi:hypothetical protein
MYLRQTIASLNSVVLIQRFPFFLLNFLDQRLIWNSYPDSIFGPTTTTRHVYDAAAQHVVSGAMQGINGNQSFLLSLV